MDDIRAEAVVARQVVVHGQVQGVFFRDGCRRRAEGHGVTGWVCNRADGTVEALLEGEPEAVESLVRWLRHGPADAVVDRVDVSAVAPSNTSGFGIR